MNITLHVYKKVLSTCPMESGIGLCDAVATSGLAIEMRKTPGHGLLLYAIPGSI